MLPQQASQAGRCSSIASSTACTSAISSSGERRGPRVEEEAPPALRFPDPHEDTGLALDRDRASRVPSARSAASISRPSRRRVARGRGRLLPARERRGRDDPCLPGRRRGASMRFASSQTSVSAVKRRSSDGFWREGQDHGTARCSISWMTTSSPTTAAKRRSSRNATGNGVPAERSAVRAVGREHVDRRVLVFDLAASDSRRCHRGRRRGRRRPGRRRRGRVLSTTSAGSRVQLLPPTSWTCPAAARSASPYVTRRGSILRLRLRASTPSRKRSTRYSASLATAMLPPPAAHASSGAKSGSRRSATGQLR